MIGYLVRRIIHMIPVLFVITLFTFMLIRLVPGDPVSAMLGPHATPEARARIEHSLHLDKPIWSQYGAFMTSLVAHGNLGDSLFRKEPVTAIVLHRLQPTIFLSLYAMVLSILISVPLATIAALNHGRVADQIVRAYVLASLAMPAYWIGMMGLEFLAVKHKIFPVAGWGKGFTGHIESLFLPALTLALSISSLMIRSLRNSILETMSADYVRTARAKGITGQRVFVWHVLRNSLLSTVTVLGINMAFLIGGTTIAETIFSIPGLGQLIVSAIFQRDYPVIQGVTLTIGVMVLIINLTTDVTYALLDPRVRLSD
jgi:peptide/nickel transport system permease protein